MFCLPFIHFQNKAVLFMSTIKTHTYLHQTCLYSVESNICSPQSIDKVMFVHGQ